MEIVSIEAFADYFLCLDASKLNKNSNETIEMLMHPPLEPDIYLLNVGLENLSSVLFSYYNRQFVILIDEFDSMVTHAIGKGYEKNLCEFLSGFCGNVFKGNAQAEFIDWMPEDCQESIFTGANNLFVSSVSCSERFGLTEAEVAKVLDDFGLSDAVSAFEEWHDGYLFCGKRMYNTSSATARPCLASGQRIPKTAGSTAAATRSAMWSVLVHSGALLGGRQ